MLSVRAVFSANLPVKSSITRITLILSAVRDRFSAELEESNHRVPPQHDLYEFPEQAANHGAMDAIPPNTHNATS